MKSRIVVLSALALTLALGFTLFIGLNSSAAGTDRFVANGGSDTTNCSSQLAPCATIQYAVTQSSAGDTVNVAAGNYNENVGIGVAQLTLKGAQAGNSVSGRTFADVNESTVHGTVIVGASSVLTVSASNVTIDGFSLTTTSNTVGSATGIDVKNTTSGTVITNNIIDGISTTDKTGNGTAQAVYLEAGPDNVSITNNILRNVHSNRSAKGVLSGDSNSSNPSLNIVISGNTISNITSDARGAYGVQINNGNGATSNTGMQVLNNEIDTLTSGVACGSSIPVTSSPCGWVHAIGLEANTPGVIVTANSISNVLATTADKVDVWFEANPGFSTSQVHENNFNDGSSVVGIAVHPAIVGAGAVDGACNWWGSSTGPTDAGNPGGTGAFVSPRVNYTPWLLSTSPYGTCGGGLSSKDCHKAAEQNEKNFNDQQKADKKAFDDQQKAAKQAFDSQPHTKDEKKAFDDQQKADKKAFDDQQDAAKQAFQDQYKADEKACKQ